MQMSHAIRAAAGYGPPAEQPQDADQDAGAESERTTFDFGAGVGRSSLPVEESMSDLMRASYFGAWRRTGGR
jgi:hypothetical protein